MTFFWNGNVSGYFNEQLETYVEIPSDKARRTRCLWHCLGIRVSRLHALHTLLCPAARSVNCVDAPSATLSQLMHTCIHGVVLWAAEAACSPPCCQVHLERAHEARAGMPAGSTRESRRHALALGHAQVPFNEAPDMKAREITEAGKAALQSGRFQMVRVNYANPGAAPACAPQRLRRAGRGSRCRPAPNW